MNRMEPTADRAFRRNRRARKDWQRERGAKAAQINLDPCPLILFQMTEKSLATSPEDVDTGASLNQEAMVRGVLRALEHLGFAEPAHRQPVVIEELEESASSPTLPRLSATSLPAFVLRRPREIDAVRAGSASATALVGATAIEAGGHPAAPTSTDEPVEADYKPRRAAVRGSARRQTPGSSRRGCGPSLLGPLPRGFPLWSGDHGRLGVESAVSSGGERSHHRGQEGQGGAALDRKGDQARRRGEPRRGSRGHAGPSTRGGGKTATAGGPPSRS